jgi:hypothetical protein
VAQALLPVRSCQAQHTPDSKSDDLATLENPNRERAIKIQRNYQRNQPTKIF